MTSRTTLLLIASLTAGAGGCSTMNNTEKGVGLGGLVGAGLGTAVGAATGNPKTGAVVGGLVGAGTGGVIGNGIDRKDQEKREVIQATAAANAAAARQLGVTEVIQMVQQGHDEQVIINQIRSTGSTYHLSVGDLDTLRANNVPSRVILEMQNARPLAAVPRPVYIREQPTVIYHEPRPVVFVRPRPCPPPGLFIHGHFH
jgi:hypothetical protein